MLAAGVVVVGVGAYNVHQGLSRDFMERMRVAGPRRRAVARLGVVGFVARGIVFGLAGVFLVKAAVEYDASEAVGIDGALARLAGQPFGPVLLGAAAAGLVAYALTCLAWAREFFKAAAPHASGGVYINFLNEDEADRIAAAYGPNYRRLKEVKAKYDPDNLFRSNQNIRPGI